MNVNLHIDSVILDGIECASGESHLLQQAVASELTTLFSREGLRTSQSKAREVGSISGGTIRLGATGTTSLSQQLAHSIHQGFNVASGFSAKHARGPK